MSTVLLFEEQDVMEATKRSGVQIDFVADLGSKGATVFDSKAQSWKKYTHEEFKEFLYNLPRGTVIVVEDAHLGVPRTSLSLAQYYTSMELLDMYNNFEHNGVMLRLFPQQVTPKARAVAGFHKDKDKTDKNDTYAIWYYLQKRPHCFDTLKHPVKSFDYSLRDLEAFAELEKINEELNWMRAYHYQHDSDLCSLFIEENLLDIAKQMTPLARSVYNVHLDAIESNWDSSINKDWRKRSGINIGGVKEEYMPSKAFYSLMINFLNLDGTPRLRKHTGRLAGIGHILKYWLRFTPFHRNGGVLRSNLFHHGFRNDQALKVGKTSDNKIRRFHTYDDKDWEIFYSRRSELRRATIDTVQAMKRVVVSKFKLDY